VSALTNQRADTWVRPYEVRGAEWIAIGIIGSAACQSKKMGWIYNGKETWICWNNS